jgi:exopolysaccharide biosynthesis protein
MKLKKLNILIPICLLIFVFLLTESFKNTDSKKIKWETQKIDNGLIWKHSHTHLFNAPQNINILEVNTKKQKVTLVYNPNQNITTSKMAHEKKATAAVNAGFFDTKNGGSVTYIKVDGNVNEKDSVKWGKLKMLNGAFMIKTNGSFEIEPSAPYKQYTSNNEYDDVLITGCLLKDNGRNISLPDCSFVNNRHPRTCLGILSKYKILLVTVDGRADEAGGMTLHELTDFMNKLGCKEIINLDGGGSTTMWINGINESGVVNMPSDNKKFDHEGERPVSNILIVE